MTDRLKFHTTSSETKSAPTPQGAGQFSGYSFVSVHSEDIKIGLRGRSRSGKTQAPARSELAPALDPSAGLLKAVPPVVELFKRIRHESTSKVKDGLMPPVVLLLLTLLYNMLVMPIQQSLRLPGMLAFVLLMLASGAVALDRCIQLRYSQADRAFQGMLAGIFFWFSADLAARLGGVDIAAQSTVVFMLLVTLVVTVLWKPVFAVGLRFFAFVFLLNWVGGFLFTKLITLLDAWNFSGQAQTVYTWITLSGIVLLALWVILQSTSRIQRLWVATGIWFLGLQTIALYWGWIL